MKRATPLSTDREQVESLSIDQSQVSPSTDVMYLAIFLWNCYVTGQGFKNDFLMELLKSTTHFTDIEVSKQYQVFLSGL